VSCFAATFFDERYRFRNVGALDELMATGFAAVIHCVSTTTPKSSNESPELDIQSNVIGTHRARAVTTAELF
jgi:hypothetical protein